VIRSARKAPQKENIMVKTSFAHVGLNCRNMAVTEKFYCKHFGFKRARVVPLGKGNKILFIRAGNVWMELFQAKGKGKAVKNDGPAEAGFRHMAFAVENVDRKIREMGKAAKVTLGPFSFDSFLKGWRGAWLKDPDGRIIEIAQGYKDEKKS
jgi:glyoxylase I family protein